MISRDTNSIAQIYEIYSKQFALCSWSRCVLVRVLEEVYDSFYFLKRFDLHMTLMWL